LKGSKPINGLIPENHEHTNSSWGSLLFQITWFCSELRQKHLRIAWFPENYNDMTQYEIITKYLLNHSQWFYNSYNLGQIITKIFFWSLYRQTIDYDLRVVCLCYEFMQRDEACITLGYVLMMFW